MVKPKLFCFICFWLLFILHGYSQKPSVKFIVPTTQKDSIEVEKMLIDAEKQYMIENYNEALNGFLKVLEKNNQHAAVYFKISESYFHTNQRKEAIIYGKKAVRFDEDNKHYWTFLGKLYKLEGDYDEAIKHFEKMLTLFSDKEEILYILLELYQTIGKIDKMFEVFDKIEKELGVKEEIILEKQSILMRQGKVEEVIKEYKKLIDLNPIESSYRVNLITFLLDNERLVEAEQEINRLETLETITSRVTFLKSELHWRRGEYQTSLALLRQVLEAKTMNFKTKYQLLSNYLVLASSIQKTNLLSELSVKFADEYDDEFEAQAFAGDLLRQINDIKSALKYYLKAVELDASNFSVWNNILAIELELSQYDSIIIHASRAFEYFPNQAMLYYYQGTAKLVKNEYEEAIETLEQGVSFSKNSKFLSAMYGQIGDAYNSVNNKQKSYQSYEKALGFQPDNVHVLNNYSYFLSLDNKEIKKALKMSLELIKKHPDNPTYLDTRGWVLYVSGDYKESKKLLKKASEMDQDPTILEHYGDVLFQLGEVNMAVKFWIKAQQKGSTSEFLDKKIAHRKIYE